MKAKNAIKNMRGPEDCVEQIIYAMVAMMQEQVSPRAQQKLYDDLMSILSDARNADGVLSFVGKMQEV